jgi:UDPglucose--hexose-1-phosphate uridylyltransferase
VTEPAAAAPHRRYNPLLDEWVLCSPQRLERPWQGHSEPAAAAALPAYDPTCYLCPGNPRASGERNPRYAHTFAFDNDFPALLPDAAGEAHGDDAFLQSRPVRGRCRVLCFSPRHDLTLAAMPADSIRGVVDAWAEEFARLECEDAVDYVQLFENKGALMGCSNPHPHCQLWATDYVPQIPARKAATQRRYHEAKGRDLLGDYLERETSAGERVVLANDAWVGLVPFWAIWPFEAMLVPRRRVADLGSLDDAERDGLARAIRDLCAGYDRLFAASFPYSMGFHGRPKRGPHDHWRLHAVYLPPLLRSATVKKFLVGYELTAEPQRDFLPEQAAERLRRAIGEARAA